MRILSTIIVFCGLLSAGNAYAQAFRAPCHVDTICPGVSRGGGRIMQCLRVHKSALSQECFASIGRSVMNWRNKGGAAHKLGGQAMAPEGENGPPNAPGAMNDAPPPAVQ